jgi:23S rRNA (adenine2503-C2)-methyltransferase
MNHLPNIRALSNEQLASFMDSIGEKKFRIQQIQEWLWLKHAAGFDDMTNLSKALRQQLSEHFSLPALTIDTTQNSADGTVKTRFTTFDGHKIEGVLIPTDERKTACVSSQIGCSLSCKFCATGYMEKKLTNIVFMGMGEPLLNYANVLQAIDRITAADGIHMSARRITVSTAGVAKQIKKLGDDGVKFKLALSLHAPTDAKRNEIMPINETNNLKALVEALNYFYAKTKNEITFEYILFKNFNDSQKDAEDLIKLYRQVPADLVNIIEYNPIDAFAFQKPDEEGMERFMQFLEKNRVNARLRRSRGKDIDAACGQLANKGK